MREATVEAYAMSRASLADTFLHFCLRPGLIRNYWSSPHPRRQPSSTFLVRQKLWYTWLILKIAGQGEWWCQIRCVNTFQSRLLYRSILTFPELAFLAINPKIKIIAPWRDPAFYDRFPGRTALLEYAAATGIPVTSTKAKPYSKLQATLS